MDEQMIPSLRLNTHFQATQAKRKNQSLAKSIQAHPHGKIRTLIKKN